ncbi:ribosomal protection-like ABC-F family protein [Alkaliphilus transvaalensis]|uniref:ribosomal protection-like ABC-F family protein n=1 Tax=Alkaliphilus transvaalensis TaxID=114628 RepID=UPI00047BC231|nr:ABC-F type ribosomal protection protein [Alkaliphilus transvaalensis]
MVHLSLKNIKKYYGGNLILNNITFDILYKEKVAIIGRNGTGKTTIFKIINQIEKQDEGQLAIKKDTTIGYLDQIPVFPQTFTVKDVLDTAFEKELKLLAKMSQMEVSMTKGSPQEIEKILKNYGELQQEFTAIGGYNMEEKLSKVSDGLKISQELMKRVFNSLSGGEKTRILLGRILLQSPDLLLLDEPSNHLDMDSIEWLEDYLKGYDGTVLIISHDRYFLDQTIGKVIEIEEGEAEVYLGNYSFYVEEKNRRLLLALEDYQNQQKKIKSMEESIKRFKDWGNRGDNPKFHKKAASIQKRLDKLERMKRPLLERKKIQVDFAADGKSGKDVIKINQLNKSFDNYPLLKDLNFHLRANEKVGILGKNGSGKSTLFKLINGEFIADAGEILIGSSAKIGYLQQNLTFPDENLSILETLQFSCNITIGEARSILAGFLFYEEDVFKRVGNLSGGERSRLRLCQLMHQDINTLILDEPTNHLDIESREMLEETLEDFKGTVLFISHDRYFINSIAQKVYELSNHRLIEYAGNYDYYKHKKLELKERKEKQLNPNPLEKKKLEKIVDGKNCNHKKIQSNKPHKPLLKIKEVEEKITSLESEIYRLDEEMIKVATDYLEVQNLQENKEQLQRDLEALMEAWLDLSTDGE